MYCMFLLARRWETVMMSTIADEGTNSDGREVTTTAQESEKTDAGMIGTTGKEKKPHLFALVQPPSPTHFP